MTHRLTQSAIDASITAENYHVFPGTTMTVCCLTVRGVLHLTGESDCVTRANFSEERGRLEARKKAMAKVWDQAAIAVKLDLYGDEVRAC
jgi:ketopantoate reductase